MVTDMGGFASAGGPAILDQFGSPLRGRGGSIYAYHRTDKLTAAGYETVINLSQPPGPLAIYKNGSILNSAQYTLSGSQITLVSALAVNDVIILDTWSTYPMTAPLLAASASDPQFAYVQSLLHFEGTNGSTTFTDVIGNTWTDSTNAAAVINTSAHAFGSSCGDFSASGTNWACITMPDVAANRIGTQDFCIEFQVYHTSNGSAQTAFSKGYVGSGDITFQTASDTNLRWVLYLSGSAILTESAAGYTTGRWYFIRVRRSGTAISIERDGTVVASGTNSTNINNSTGSWSLGAASAHSRSNPLYGYMDEFRLTIGNARAANVVQTAAWPDH